MKWSHWIRQTHRWLSMAFTLAVIVTAIVLATAKASRLGELHFPAPALPAAVHRSVLVRAAVCRQVAQRATYGRLSDPGVRSMRC